MNPLTQSKNTTILSVLSALALACFAFSPQARAVCQDACLANFNTVQGDNALINLTTGASNTAFGANALLSVTSASGNTAVGVSALHADTTGYENTATGFAALVNNTSGYENTATGDDALSLNTTGYENTATGFEALAFNTTGYDNTANGFQALFNNTTGNSNTADGFNALFNNTTGSFNIAVGNGAGGNLTTGINNIDIGNNGVAGESKTIRIGKSGKQTNTFIAGISGVTVPTGVAVIIDASGHLGTTTSSERFKDAIKPMDKASEAILALQPITFRYKKELDPEGIPQFGLVAEEVEKVNPDLVARDDQGKPYSVRYEAVNAMLLNEFLKEHRKVEELEATVAIQEDLRTTVAQQQKEIQALIARLNRQESRMQKVNDQLEERNFAPQRIADNQ